MFQVDAFTDRLFSGNPAAVIILEDWLSGSLMLSIAQENNLAETAFVRLRRDGAWDVRWFSPVHEVDFCGHATLAAAHVLLTEAAAKAPLVFRTKIGQLRVTISDRGYHLNMPSLPPQPLAELPSPIAGIFETPPVAVFRNFENFFADLGSADAVRSFTPDLDAIATLGSVGLAVTGREDAPARADFVSRYFAPGSGIPEDPVTGAIHATLVPYWADKLARGRLAAYQASKRGGWIDCELLEDRVVLVGRAVTFMSAVISLPEEA